jgi:hypothetical protein
VRVASFEQSDFLGARPSFQLLLADQSLVDIVVGFPAEPADDVVTGGESFVMMEFVQEHPLVKIAGHSDVQRARQAYPDVDAVVTSVAHKAMIGEGWSLRR